MSYRWLFSSALLLACSLVVAADPAEGVSDDRSARLRFAMDPFDKPVSSSCDQRNEKEKILQRFGEPIEESVSTHETRFIDQTQTSYEYKYADVQFIVVETNDGPHMFVQKIEIDGNTHALKYGVQIGTGRAEIISLFSPIERYASSNPMLVSVPTLETQSSFEKSGGIVVGYVPTYDITFEFDENDRVSRIAVLIAADE